MPYEIFDFEKEGKKYYHNNIVYTKSLSEMAKTKGVYSDNAIYALYENNQLKKIGKAIYKEYITEWYNTTMVKVDLNM